jgi:hypothetical protein
MAILTTTQNGLDFIGGTAFIQTGGTTLMAIETGGFIGIGVNDPEAKLHVKVGTSGGGPYDSSVAFHGEGASRVIAQLSSTADAYFMFGDAAVNNQAWLGYQHSTNNLELHTGATITLDGGIQFTNSQYAAVGTLVTDASGNITVSSGGGAGGPYLPLSAGSSYPLTGPLYITSDGGAANGAEIYLKHANNNTTDTIGTLFFGNNADATLSSIVVETNGANNTSNLKLNTSNAGTMSTALTLQGDNDAIFTGNVGIGETSPGVKLQLLSADEQLTKFSSSVADQLAYSQINASSSTSGVITAAAALELVGKANASGHGRHAWIGAEGTPNTNTKTKLKFKIRGETASGYNWAGASEAPTIMTLEGDGNVGIGTVSPDQLLDVSRTATTFSGASTDEGAVIRISNPSNWENGYDGNGFIGGIEFHSGDASEGGPGVFGAIKQRQLTYYNTQAMCFFTRPYNGTLTERMRIDAAGAIKFNAYGAGTLVTDASGNITAATSGPGTGTVTGTGTTGVLTKFTDGANGVIGDSILAVTADSLDFTNADFAQIKFKESGAIMIDSDNDQSSRNFQIKDGSGSSLLTVLDTGNVGIGTTGPGRKLTVAGDVSGDANNLLLSNENDTDGDSASIGFSMLSNNTYVKSGIFFKRTTTQGRGDLIFANNNEVNGNNVTLSDAKITIQPGGNVGIGTDSPSTTLSVKGTSSNGINIIGVGTTATRCFLGLNSANKGYLFIAGSSGENPAVITSQGDSYISTNLGIGVTGPTAKLDVRGSAVFRGSYLGVTIAPSATGADMYFYEGNNPKIYLQSGGPSAFLMDVGIGESNPQRQLHVNSGTTNVVARFESTDTTAAIEFKDNNGSAEIGNTGDNLVFFPAGAEKMRITSGGQVGIGITTNTTIPLHVNQTGSGTVIKAQGIGATIEIQSGTAGNATLYQRPNITGDKEAEFRCTLGSTYGWSWKDDNATATSRVKFMKLDQNPGTLTVKGDVVAYGSPSDKRLKENIKPIESALDKVMKLQGVTFDWKQKEDVILDIKEDIGFIAQDVQKVVPELIRENSNGLLSMRHQGMAPILLEAIKELKAEIDLLKSKSCNCK